MEKEKKEDNDPQGNGRTKIHHRVTISDLLLFFYIPSTSQLSNSVQLSWPQCFSSKGTLGNSQRCALCVGIYTPKRSKEIIIQVSTYTQSSCIFYKATMQLTPLEKQVFFRSSYKQHSFYDNSFDVVYLLIKLQVLK